MHLEGAELLAVEEEDFNGAVLGGVQVEEAGLEAGGAAVDLEVVEDVEDVEVEVEVDLVVVEVVVGVSGGRNSAASKNLPCTVTLSLYLPFPKWRSKKNNLIILQ